MTSQIDNEGLPALDKNKAENKGVKKPSVVFLFLFFIVIGGIVFAIQYSIDSYGLFKKQEVIIKEPPLPALQFDIVNENEMGDHHDKNEIDGSEIGGGEESEGDLTVYDELSVSVSVLIEEVKNLSGVLKEQQKSINIILGNQVSLMKSMTKRYDDNMDNVRKVQSSLKDNARWLNGISNQLDSIGIEVKAASQDFPIIIYSRNIWGDDIYLTIADKKNPEQTSSLRVGGVVGKWELVEISGNKAVFKHFEGLVKEVVL